MNQKTNLKISIAQCQFSVGDLTKNHDLTVEAYEKAVTENADLLVFSELSVCGYPPEDAVLLCALKEACMDEVAVLAKLTAGKETAMIVGSPWIEGEKLYNSIMLLADGEIKYIQHKYDLPNYGVFDEKRIFDGGKLPEPFEYKNIKLGIMICEDVWSDDVPCAMKDADILVSINASPFEVGKTSQRRVRAQKAVAIAGKPMIYTNQICGQDDLVFDGGSFALDGQGNEILTMKRFAADYQVVELSVNEGKQLLVNSPLAGESASLMQVGGESLSGIPSTESHHINTRSAHSATTRDIYFSTSSQGGSCQPIYQAMMLGLKDYVEKNHFPGVLIGLSGGIDSALSAAVAVDALGAEKVRCVMMPSEYTSDDSLEDAEECAKMLGCRYDIIDIDKIRTVFEAQLKPLFEGKPNDIAEENLQSRIRGSLLMALSNKHGDMVLSTGNKSEVAVGYATLYGDMAGGYNVLKDAYKMQVFALAKWRNENFPPGSKGKDEAVMPQRVITKPPSAELRHDQKDEDSLPPYDVLDGILELFIEERMRPRDIIAKGFAEETVRHVVKLVHRAEYKRRQSAPGVKISKRPFGRDRRYPITNGFF